jgi:hypothetical protein
MKTGTAIIFTFILTASSLAMFFGLYILHSVGFSLKTVSQATMDGIGILLLGITFFGYSLGLLAGYGARRDEEATK